MGILNIFKKRKEKPDSEQKWQEKRDLSKISSPSLKESINNWQEQVSILEDHPLSQARVINTQVFEGITSVISSIDEKLSDLGKLDKILELLEALKTEKLEENVENEPKSALEFALTKVNHLSIKDKDVVELLENQGPMSAREAGKRLELTRSTISYRLNRLYNMGILEKMASGRTIKFRPANKKLQ